MNNVYVLIIHGGQPSTYTTAPLEITGSPRQHKLSITLQTAYAAQQAKAKLSLQNIDTCKAKLLWPTGSVQCPYITDTQIYFFYFNCSVFNMETNKMWFLQIKLVPLLKQVFFYKYLCFSIICSLVFLRINMLKVIFHLSFTPSVICTFRRLGVCCLQPTSCSGLLRSTACCCSGVK